MHAGRPGFGWQPGQDLCLVDPLDKILQRRVWREQDCGCNGQGSAERKSRRRQRVIGAG